MSELQDRAAELAKEHSHVESLPLSVELSGDVDQDVVYLSGFTLDELSSVGIKSGSTEMDQLMRVLLVLAGGLKPEGIRIWLENGQPSHLQRIASGDVREVQREVNGLLYSPFT